jgi:hypothetical protein
MHAYKHSQWGNGKVENLFSLALITWYIFISGLQFSVIYQGLAFQPFVFTEMLMAWTSTSIYKMDDLLTVLKPNDKQCGLPSAVEGWNSVVSRTVSEALPPSYWAANDSWSSSFPCCCSMSWIQPALSISSDAPTASITHTQVDYLRLCRGLLINYYFLLVMP